MKMISEGWSIIKLPGINYINELYTLEQLVELFHNNHVFVYPSYGEGFGLNPLQALATGMPTITLPAWAPYAKYIHPKLAIPSNLQKTPWPLHHPGAMFKPDQDAVTEAVRYAYNNYEELVEWHVAQVPELVAEYSWDTITAKVFSDLENRLKNSSKLLP
jgi:glycosyltransferase involved in cell wall biosynthesis